MLQTAESSRRRSDLLTKLVVFHQAGNTSLGKHKNLLKRPESGNYNASSVIRRLL